MPEKGRRESNIIIHGYGTGIGGVADKVTIHGQGRMKGDLDCNRLTIHGNATIQGIKLKSAAADSPSLRPDISFAQPSSKGIRSFWKTPLPRLSEAKTWSLDAVA